MNTNFYEQEHCMIYGHNVWHYLISCPIGYIHIIQYESQGMELISKYYESNDAAEKYFQSICKKLLSGKML